MYGLNKWDGEKQINSILRYTNEYSQCRSYVKSLLKVQLGRRALSHDNEILEGRAEQQSNERLGGCSSVLKRGASTTSRCCVTPKVSKIYQTYCAHMKDYYLVLLLSYPHSSRQPINWRSTVVRTCVSYCCVKSRALELYISNEGCVVQIDLQSQLTVVPLRPPTPAPHPCEHTALSAGRR